VRDADSETMVYESTQIRIRQTYVKIDGGSRYSAVARCGNGKLLILTTGQLLAISSKLLLQERQTIKDKPQR